MLLGVSKENFEILLAHCTAKLRNSSNRSIRSCLAIFLMKLRLNISQRVLAFLFSISHQSTVSKVISSVLKALLGTFVPLPSGYAHISRQELLNTHMRKFFTSILGVPTESLILILDGTYLFVEKASDFQLQRRSYSVHKKRSLFKPMMAVCPDGYIIEATGLFYGDSGNNDANILTKMMSEEDSIMSIMGEDDVLVLDRGFRDAIAEVESQGLVAFMPELLKKGKDQFTTSEANRSRLVTMIRWIVESANGRLKHKFKFFDDTIPASYFPKLPGFLKVAVAILNAFSPPLFTETDWNEDLAELVEQRLLQRGSQNLVQTLVETEKLKGGTAKWDKADVDCVLEFPELTLDDPKLITLGPYQLRVGALYNTQHLSSSSGYDFYLHKDKANLLRIKLQSRFSKRRRHMVWIDFVPWGIGQESINGWYCLCKNGARTLGCCGHVAAVLRFYLTTAFNHLFVVGDWMVPVISTQHHQQIKKYRPPNQDLPEKT